jgi:hypothetical protein
VADTERRPDLGGSGRADDPCTDHHLEPVELGYNTAYGATEFICTACGAEWLVAD